MGCAPPPAAAAAATGPGCWTAGCRTTGPVPDAAPSTRAVCTAGQKLTPAQAALLRIFDQKQATFRMRLLAVWENDEVEELAADSEGEDNDGEEGGDGIAWPEDA